jgi:hypothetical protein
MVSVVNIFFGTEDAKAGRVDNRQHDVSLVSIEPITVMKIKLYIWPCSLLRASPSKPAMQ